MDPLPPDSSPIQTLREIVGEDLYFRLRQRLGGRVIYLPKLDTARRARNIHYRYLRCRQEGQGHRKALATTAHHFGLTTRRVEQILADVQTDATKES